MDLKIVWTDFSKNELIKIFDYYNENASIKIVKKLVDGITKRVKVLSEYPELGQKEFFLRNRKENFRYLIYKNFKIIYWINKNKNRIEIVDIFDTSVMSILI